MDFDFNQLLEQLNTLESYTLLTLLLSGLLVGLILGLLLRGGPLRRLRRKNKELREQVDERDRQLADQQDSLATAGEKVSAAKKDNEQLRRELEEARSRVQQMEQQKTQLYKEVSLINKEVEKLQHSNQNYLTTIDNLQSQVNQLKGHNEALTAKMARQEQTQIQPAAALLGQEDQELLNRLETLERKMLHIESENISLKQEVDELRAEDADHQPMPAVKLTPAPETAPAILPEQPQPPDAIQPTDEEQDDLTLIEGIGAFIAKKLKELRIYTFQQISQWDQRDVQEITAKLEYFEGRIEKDNWIEQAQRLHHLKTEDPEAFRRLSPHPSDPENLKIIEGVGPKIEQLLKNSGIYTWEDLADSSTENLKSILEAAGPSHRFHDPETWPIQARLAVNKDWGLLKEYQEQVAGRSRPPLEEE